jgi:hypothetical protein
LRDDLPAQLLDAFGVPTPAAAYVQVTLDLGDGPVLLGLYTMIETPDDPLLVRAFGDSDGNLYKPQGSGATWAAFDADSFEKKTHASDADWTDIEAAINALHAPYNDDPVAWRSEFERVFDVDGFLRWLAVTRLMGNWDAYGQMAQNYYLYHSTSDDLIHWIPWDNNMSWSAGNMQRASATIDPRTDSEQWPLLSVLLNDPVYFHAYVAYVAEALDTVFDEAQLETRILETYAAIAPSIADEDGILSQYSFVDSAEEVSSAVNQVLETARGNVEKAKSFLAAEMYTPTPIVISEIYYNVPSDEGAEEEYEFVELYNRGESTVDLSGYRFDKGIELTIPNGTQLGPSQCLMIAHDAATYEDLPCPVLEWERGSLSNGGETLRLVDADGDWVDVVTYSDRTPWPSSADGEGASLELIDPAQPNHIPSNWAASTATGGTPGTVRDET